MEAARNAMSDLIYGVTKGYIAFSVAKLDIVDYLCKKSMTSEELASITSTDRELLHRLLRAAVSIGILTENEQKQFSVTDLGLTLKTRGDFSVKNFVLFQCGLTPHPVSKLLNKLKSGNKFAKESLFGRTQKDPEFKSIVYGSIKEFNEQLKSDLLIPGYDYSKYKYIVDVGGATGTFLINILQKTPKSRGTVFDLASVTELAEEEINNSSVKERCAAVAGDFFISVPPDADCYILKFVLHNWDDENALKILQTIRKGMKRESILLIMEMIKPEGRDPNPVDIYDIWFLSFVPGKQRYKREFEHLFEKASLKLKQVVEIEPCIMKIIEVQCD